MGNSSRKHGPSCRGRSFFVLFFPAFNCYNQLTFTRFCAASPSFRAWQVQYGLENPTTFYINMSFQLFAKLMFHEELAIFTRFALFSATRLYICEQLRRDPFRLAYPPRFPARIALLCRLLCSAYGTSSGRAGRSCWTNYPGFCAHQAERKPQVKSSHASVSLSLPPCAAFSFLIHKELILLLDELILPVLLQPEPYTPGTLIFPDTQKQPHTLYIYYFIK